MELHYKNETVGIDGFTESERSSFSQAREWGEIKSTNRQRLLGVLCLYFVFFSFYAFDIEIFYALFTPYGRKNYMLSK